jgi:hypothetical protein
VLAAAGGETNSESFVLLLCHPYWIDSLAGNQGKIEGNEGERGRKRLVLLLGIGQTNLFIIFPYPLHHDLCRLGRLVTW